MREGDRYVTDLESGDRLMGVHIGQTSSNGTPYVCSLTYTSCISIKQSKRNLYLLIIKYNYYAHIYNEEILGKVQPLLI